ncbi:polyphosphate kinase 2 [Gilvimarinus agarilyticus]|uniref:polyphosphate kinase 2 n=1 Tax=Gilvimarinus agarilyticus TaxID=679259 RepID=UPI0005A05CB7|nr:polyphosphate kinase 2 [Gilvimarinus agarilyticus]
MSNIHYKESLHHLQVELVKLQKHLIASDLQLLVIFEGRDAAGKDGVIKRIVEHLSPRETRVVALGKPSDQEQKSWYFQRYVAHLPKAQEMVLMNRSWYNRAGVERVMGFCSEAQYRQFIDTVVDFEALLNKSGVQIVKYYLDIDREEQAKRLQARRDDPLKQWKISPIDAVAQERWDDYSQARNAMLMQTHRAHSPWTIVNANNKKRARLAVIRHLLQQVESPARVFDYQEPNPDIIFTFDKKHLHDGHIAP